MNNKTETHKMKRPFKKNDQVKILPQWQDEGDDEITFVCVEDEDGGRVRIEALIDLPINPQQVVDVHMIEHHN
jgi:hypothetical protein